ncbi:aprataxin and PNK-like factor isoform X2 [Octodon degus]|nr:aprataxin and PNK-like factor isoform X2 [Octodon degus]
MGDQLRIKPVHTNPCFYRSSEDSELFPMKANLWHWLNPGDSFSLLVDRYIFCVVSTYSEMELECTLRNSQMLDEDDKLNEAPKSPVINLPDKKPGASHLERTTEITETQTTATNSLMRNSRDLSEQQSDPAQRKRILPAWMLQDLSDQKLSVPVISGDNNVIQGSGKGVCKEKTHKNLTQQGRKRISSGNSESVTEGQDAGKRFKDTGQDEPVSSSKDMSESFSATTLNNPDMHSLKSNTQKNEIPIVELGKISEHENMTKGTLNEEDEVVSFSDSRSSVPGKPLHSVSQTFQPKSKTESSSSETLQAKARDLLPQSSQEDKVRRSPCMYGANCYRRNPVHFQHFSHPGDSDYGGVRVTGQDETDERPECPYGASCYRKNPQHKIEYRHSRPQVSSAAVENAGADQPSDSDASGSFQDDGEEEYEPTDEDSDWEPGKEDQDQEDVEELLKEAKKFMKRKK